MQRRTPPSGCPEMDDGACDLRDICQILNVVLLDPLDSKISNKVKGSPYGWVLSTSDHAT